MRKLATLAILASMGTASQAQTLLLYTNFNDTTSAGAFLTSSTNLLSGSYAVTGASAAPTLTSPANGQFGSFGGTTINARNSDPAGGSFVVVGTGANGSTLTLQLNTMGWQDLVLKAAIRNTSTGFNDIDVDVSTNGGAWTSVIANVSPLTTSFALNVNSALGAATDNVSDVRVRWTFNGATNTSGNMRMDNITIEGNQAVPEPATLAALGLGVAALARRRRLK